LDRHLWEVGKGEKGKREREKACNCLVIKNRKKGGHFMFGGGVRLLCGHIAIRAGEETGGRKKTFIFVQEGKKFKLKGFARV